MRRSRTKLSSASKGVAYGVSALIWIIAIAVLLVAALIGLSREIKVKSSPVSYRLISIEAMRLSQQIYSYLDEERRYTLEQVLLYTGVLGGYTPKQILLSEDPPPYIVLNESLGYGSDLNKLPQRYLVYWVNESGNYEKIPSEQDVIGNASEFARQGLATLASPLYAALAGIVGYEPKVTFELIIDKFTHDYIEAHWIPAGQTHLTILLPSPTNPVVEYSFDLFVHNRINTSFLDVYNEAKNFALENWLVTRYFNDTNKSAIPTILDSEFLIVESNQSAPEPFNFTAQVEASRPTPMKRLLEYADSLPNDPIDCDGLYNRIYLDYWDQAEGPEGSIKVDCTLHAVRKEGGILDIDGFYGNDCDKPPIKYVMCKILNKINHDLKLPLDKPDYVPGELFDSKYDYRIQIFELNLSLNSMWFEHDDYNKSGTCKDAAAANLQGQTYVFHGYSRSDSFGLVLIPWSKNKNYREYSCNWVATCRDFALVPIVTFGISERALMVYTVKVEGSQGFWSTGETEVGKMVILGNRTVLSPVIIVHCSQTALVNPWLKIKLYDGEGNLVVSKTIYCDWPTNKVSIITSGVEVGGENYICDYYVQEGGEFTTEKCPIGSLYNCTGAEENVISQGELQPICDEDSCDNTCEEIDTNYTENSCCGDSCLCGVFGSQKCGDVAGVEHKVCLPFYLIGPSSVVDGNVVTISVVSNSSFSGTNVSFQVSSPSCTNTLTGKCTINDKGICRWSFTVNTTELGCTTSSPTLNVRAWISVEGTKYFDENVNNEFWVCTNLDEYDSDRMSILVTSSSSGGAE